MQYIQSILDTDLYKLTQQQAVLKCYSDDWVKYKFTNRNTSMKFNVDAYLAIVNNVKKMKELCLNEGELLYLQTYKFLSPHYLDYLRDYEFDPNQVTIKYLDGELDIEINGRWVETILWEVPLMAIISEAYFTHVDIGWGNGNFDGEDLHPVELIQAKAKKLATIPNNYSDFGTRRRRSYYIQDMVVRELSRMHLQTELGAYKGKFAPNFAGTSNVFLAMKYGVPAIGTMAHEWIMGCSVLEGLRHANRHALNKWDQVYHGELAFALTDTYGTDAFFDDFDYELASRYKGVRHDSGCPFTFAKKVVDHYHHLGIDPGTKNIIFSDGLNVDTALVIAEHCKNLGVPCSFGIGTHFTNDFGSSKPLNMVIKLREVNDIPVVKLSDSPTKATGDKDALRVAMWTFFNKPLDA